jgi:hypothetical protein
MPKGKKKRWKYINKVENNYLQRTTDFGYTCNRELHRLRRSIYSIATKQGTGKKSLGSSRLI